MIMRAHAPTYGGLVLVTALATALTGCQTPPPPQVGSWIAAGGTPPPPQGACRGVAHMDLTRLAREQAGRPRDPRNPDATGFIDLPASAEALIPADALVVIRARLPATAQYQNEVLSVVWRSADGRWSGWRQDRQFGTPPPPPPPPPPPGAAEGTPAYRAAMEARDLYERTQRDPDLRWPPRTGPLTARTVQSLETALADPCRAWDPADFPFVQPLRRRENGSDTRMCPPGGGRYLGDITEPGRPRRAISADCINDTPTYQLISATADAEPEG